MLDKIIKNHKENKRRIYEEPPIDIYDEQYFKTQCGGFELFNYSQGLELDDVSESALNLCTLQPDYFALDTGCRRGELVL